MANKNTKAKRRALAKAFATQRKAGIKIIPPARKGGVWHGEKGWRPALVAQSRVVKG